MKQFFIAAIATVGLTGLSGAVFENQSAIAQRIASRRQVDVGNYAIQAPQNYSVQPLSNAPSPAYGYALVGPTRSDGTTGQLWVIYRPYTGPSKPSVEDVMQKRLDALRKHYLNWLQSGLEIVSINGIPFHRVRWVGVHQTRQVPMQGFLYVTQHQGEIIYLQSQDLTSHQTDLMRANAVAMSFSLR